MSPRPASKPSAMRCVSRARLCSPRSIRPPHQGESDRAALKTKSLASNCRKHLVLETGPSSANPPADAASWRVFWCSPARGGLAPQSRQVSVDDLDRLHLVGLASRGLAVWVVTSSVKDRGRVASSRNPTRAFSEHRAHQSRGISAAIGRNRARKKFCAQLDPHSCRSAVEKRLT